jgi:hemolysin III
LLVAFVVLAARTPTRHGDRLAIVVYALGVTTMFAVSAVYHSGRLSPATTRVFQRIDHGTILLAIAGTYTAVTALAVTGRARAVLLTAVWIAAAVAAFIQVFRINAPRILGAIGYLVVGWFAAFDLPAYLRGTTNAEFAWIVAGGLAYSVGAVVYARKRPNPNPAVFGFHEVFHALTVVGATAHFVAVALMVSAL